MKELRFFQAMREALVEEMERDEKVFMLGESIEGGSFLYTKGLVEKFGQERIMDTPLAETALCGSGIGSALAGYRPVVDLMFADFMYVAGDEIFLKSAQWRFIHGGKITLPIVFLMGVGGGRMLCNEHSHIPSSLVLRSPGLKLAVPSNPYDAKGLLKTAIRDDNPVCFFWHKVLMMKKGDVPEEEYTIPFGLANIRREGTDVTVVAVSNMVNYALAVADELEGRISVEVIDPRTLEPLDMETILKSVEKTGHVVVVDEDTERCGLPAEIGFQIQEKAFDSLDAPIKRVCAANYPIAGGHMEKHILPQPAQIKAAIEAVMA
jgi:pyruvate dehydrogenase E1 component beta subunit